MDIESDVMDYYDSTLYKSAFDDAERHFNEKKIKLALSGYLSCIPLTKQKDERSLCYLKAITCELFQTSNVSNLGEYLQRLEAHEKSGNDSVELERLKVLVLLSEKSSLRIDLLTTRAQIFNFQQLPRNANPYARCLLDVGAPKKAIDILMRFDSWRIPKPVAMNRLVLLAECHDMLDEIDKAIYCLQQANALGDNSPAWIKGKIKSLEILSGNCTEFGSSTAVEIYHRLEKGDSSVITELEVEKKPLSDVQITPYIAAVAALKGTPQAIAVAEGLFFNAELTQLARCRALNFLLPYVSNSLVETIDVPTSYEFLDLALIKFETLAEFQVWLKRCPGGGDPSKNKIIKKILASDSYCGGTQSCSFNGSSSIYRKEEGANKLVIVFCGLHGDLFWKPESLVYLLENKGFSVLWLNDRSGNNFLTGLESYGKNGFEIIASLSSLIREDQYESVVCMGASAGGSAAALAGFALQVKKVVGLSPATFIENEVGSRALKVEGKFSSHFTSKQFSLNNMYSNTGAPLLDIHFGEKSIPDRKYSEHMIGVPGVSFHPIKGWRQHAITDVLIRTGEFEKIIDQLF